MHKPWIKPLAVLVALWTLTLVLASVATLLDGKAQDFVIVWAFGTGAAALITMFVLFIALVDGMD